MTNDETMARIEAALDDYAEACVQEFRSSEVADVRKAVEAKTAALALIREALPKPDAASIAEGYAQIDRGESIDIDKWTDELRQRADAEHEAKVEAWLARAHFVNGNYLVSGEDIDEALRLMRARPQHKETTPMASELTPEAIARLRNLSSGLWRRKESQACAALMRNHPPALLDAAERCAAAEAQAKAAGELLRAARSAVFEGLTVHHEVPRLIPSEKLRESLNGLRTACVEAERAGVK